MQFHIKNGKVKIPFRLKVTLGVSLLLALVLLFFFGVTFFFIALAGGLLSMVASLFGVKRQSGIKIRVSHHGGRPPGPDTRPKQRIRDDDVIDI